MIIDYRNDFDHAKKFDILDCWTGRHVEPPAYYADDERGYIEYYERNPAHSGRGSIKAGPDGRPITKGEYRTIRIVPRDPPPADAPAAGPAVTITWARP